MSGGMCAILTRRQEGVQQGACICDTFFETEHGGGDAGRTLAAQHATRQNKNGMNSHGNFVV